MLVKIMIERKKNARFKQWFRENILILLCSKFNSLNYGQKPLSVIHG